MDEVAERLGRPIPLPGSEADRREVDALRMEVLERKSKAYGELAQLVALPQWAFVRGRCLASVESMLNQLAGVWGPERDQLVGAITAWRAFVFAPEAAAQALRKVNMEVDRLRSGEKR